MESEITMMGAGIIRILLAGCFGAMLGGTIASAQTAGDATATPPDSQAFGDWVLACQAPKEGAPKRCAAQQRLASAKDKKPVFLWQWTYDEQGALVTILTTPPGLRLDKGIQIGFDPEKPSVVLFQQCEPSFCNTAFKVTSEQLVAAVKAETIEVQLFPPKGDPVKLKISGKGLTDALAALKAQ